MGVVPFAVKRAVYDTSVVPLLILADETSGFCNILIGTRSVSFPPAFEALTVMLKFPALLGVPLNNPVVLILIPDGCPEIRHVIGAVPFEVVNCTPLYASPTIPSARLPGSTITGICALIVILIVFVTGLFSSCVAIFSAVILMLYVPALCGVPEIVHVSALKLRPSGRFVAVTVSGAVPVMVNAEEYSSLTTAFGRLEVLITGFSGFAFMVKLTVISVTLVPAVAVILTLKFPAVLGVPEMSPALLNDNPEGRLDDARHVTVPEAVTES